MNGKEKEIKQKIVNIDRTKDKKIFDTKMMDSWSDEDWAEWVGTEKDYGINVVFEDDEEIYLQLSSLADDEVTSEFILGFIVKNRANHNLKIQWTRLLVDHIEFDSSGFEDCLLKSNQAAVDIELRVNHQNFKGQIVVGVQVIDAVSLKLMKDIVLDYKLF
ncbi:hypothetical protein [Bacillus massiliigorillae]|uniref:hypothetical protein n=1 Tax=Bacillus massiliigorillae TaxID=1243664 RepID=UPI00039F401C|nr:hypothetical protein [Bacillus massiliigorillae]